MTIEQQQAAYRLAKWILDYDQKYKLPDDSTGRLIGPDNWNYIIMESVNILGGSIKIIGQK